MKETQALSTTKKAATRINKNSKIFKTIIAAIQNKKGENIVSLDLRKIPEAVADFFIICTATSNPQVKAIADNVEDEVEKICNEKPYKKQGNQSQHWVLIDFVSIVVHIMQPQARQFYTLEEMWSDADINKHEI